MAKNNHKQPGETQQRILVIDDSPIIRGMLVEILTDEGYIVDTAEDGKKGVTQALKKDYMVIICDVHMPHKNGFEAVREIMDTRPFSKIIITDSFPDKLAKEAQAEGALCCLQKPFDVNELRGLIRQIKSGRIITIGR